MRADREYVDLLNQLRAPAREAGANKARMRTAANVIEDLSAPISIRLTCPGTNPDGSPCARLHIDEGLFATKRHHTHACQHCGHVWRPAIVDTVGVQFLPGFKNGDSL